MIEESTLVQIDEMNNTYCFECGRFFSALRDSFVIQTPDGARYRCCVDCYIEGTDKLIEPTVESETVGTALITFM